ncbi:hypothetical protein C8D82_14319 [Victivallis vadensis]|uniref:Uncharacterized protein n=2 Tax=Victivallis vadensis TaxID=172901 RepID=A0A2U1AFH4_9BACT|nr:hypothetical protein C8D82_14319 [Victivallis vadensis]
MFPGQRCRGDARFAFENMSDFVCVRCGNCCRWSGCVKVTDAEIDVIAAFLGMPPEAFLERWTELMPDRQGLTLIEKADGSCVFLEEGEPAGCRIDPVKPEQCRRFPERWNFPGWEKECGAKLSRK